MLYICGNRFVLINAHPFDVRVSWRVQGTEEQGEQALKAAPAGDPGFSEFELTVRHEGRLAVYRGDELLAVRDNERTACAPITGDPSFAAAAASAAGQWSAPSPWPIVAVHMHLLFNGKVLAWGKFGDPYECGPRHQQLHRQTVAELALLCRPHLPVRRPAAGGRGPHQRRPRKA